MRKTFSRLTFILSLLAFATSSYQVAQHWDYQETLTDLNQSLQRDVSKEQITQAIQQAIDAAEFDDARMYLTIARDNHYALDYATLQQSIQQQDTTIRQISAQASNFAQGFLQGKSGNMAGIAGSVTADFTVIGDVRDLSHEYSKHQKGEDINELIALLSGAGIGLTVLTVSTMGTAAPAKTGASVIKVAVKTQRVSLRFQKHLIKLGRKIFDWPAFTRLIKNDNSLRNLRRAARQAYHPEAIEPLKKMAQQVNRIRLSTSTVDTVHLLKYIDEPKQLSRLEKISAKYGAQTKGMMTLLGKGALRTVRILRKTTALFLSVISLLISGLFSLFFGLKVLKKAFLLKTHTPF